MVCQGGTQKKSTTTSKAEAAKKAFRDHHQKICTIFAVGEKNQ
jgi:hypothetical protein